jgi:probable FeS assembly SUF system protein SufT
MINSQTNQEVVTLKRDCPALMIPSGSPTVLEKGERAIITQALGGSYTVIVNGNLYRVEGKDADALGKAPEKAPGDKAQTKENRVDERAVWDVLKSCYDPEIPVNIVDLGLIYSCEFDPTPEGTIVEIKMTLTAPGCGMGGILADEVRQKVQALPGVLDVKVELVWDPPWNQGMMSEAARLQLGMF